MAAAQAHFSDRTPHMARKRNRKPKGQTGRPSQMADPVVRERLLKALAVGFPIEVACNAAGISRSTLTNWQSGNIPADVDPDEASEFMAALARANDEGMVNIATELAQDMRGRMFILERRRPELFGKVDRHEVSGPDGGPIVSAGVDLSQLPDAAVAKLAEVVDALEESDE